MVSFLLKVELKGGLLQTEYARISYLTEDNRTPILKASGNSEKLEGKYANYFEIGHNAYEFVIDFGQYYHETDQAELSTRIITSPVYAKAFLETLKDSIEKYETDFGSIKAE